MAMTLSSVASTPLGGGYVMVCGLATASNVYLTGGETMDLSSYLLSSSSPVVVLSGDDGLVPFHTRGTAAAGKVKLYMTGANAAAALNELTNATDASAVICTFVAIGQTP